MVLYLNYYLHSLSNIFKVNGKEMRREEIGVVVMVFQ